MKKLVVFMTVAVFAIALSGCQEEAKIADEPEAPAEEVAVVIEEVTAEEKTPVTEEPTPVQPEEVVVKEVAVQEEKIAVAKEPAPEPMPTPQPKAVEEVDANAVVVTVNGLEITEKKVSEEVAKRIVMQKKRMPPGTEVPDAMRQQVRNRVVDMEVEQVLLAQEMKKNNVTVSDEQVLAEITKIAGKNGQSMEEVEKEIANYGMTINDLKGQIRTQMQVKALTEAMNPDAVATEADAKKFYDENPHRFSQPDQVKASHILCGKRGIKEDEYPAELEKIEAAKARLDAGEAFEDVAKDVSTCPSSAKGGDLGFFGKGQMDPAFEKAAFELEPGQATGIVKTSFGYHIIKVTDKKEAGKTSFEEIGDKITEFLTQQKQAAIWAEQSKIIHDNATIEYSAKEQALRAAAQKAASAYRAMPQPTPAPKPAETK